MALTPKDILDISEPVEAIYQRTVDELLINIARHFRTDATERTRYWEIKKLSEMGALTKESAAIIAKNTGMLPEEVERAFLQVSEKACLDVDPQLRAAAEQGILQDPGTSPSTSPTVRRMVQSYVDQAVDKTNMTNTTMLESTRRAYLASVQTVVSEEQLAEANTIISAEALEVATGQETRTRAIRKAMDQLGRNGIAGFYDRSGRAWSPDAYAAMVVRTTSHNAAIGAIRSRQQEYGGGDIFQVSTHGGARPLCYPYQGKFYTWSSGGGTFKDGAGQEHKYEPITATSYGEPAGLFGINCGHHPIPMIPGFSYPQEGPTQDEEENRREYEESQRQRQLERNIRNAKRDLAMADATGDEDLVDQMEAKVKREQAKMRAFIKQTGRARRYDREQIPDGTTGPVPKLQTKKPTTPTPEPAPTTQSFGDRIRGIRGTSSGAPTTQQIRQAGRVMAEEYAQRIEERRAIYQPTIDERTAEIERLTAQADALKEERERILDALPEPDNPYDAIMQMASQAGTETAERLDDIYNDLRGINTQIEKARDAIAAAQNSIIGTQAERMQWTADMIAQVRPVGSEGLDVAGHLGRSRSSVRPRIETAYAHYPRAWVEASIARGELKPEKTDRGYYSDWQHTIAISGATPEKQTETAVHELGHRFEYSVEGIRDQEREFYEVRTAGEDAEWLGYGYRRDERTRKDQFISPYMGKDYGGRAFELVSMGFQYAYTHPELLAKDPDMQEWIYGLLLMI